MEIELLKLMQEAEKDYANPSDLNATQKKLVDELVEIQRHINDVKARLEAFKEKKSEVDPIIVEMLKKLKVDGVLLEKALVYLQSGKTVPSFQAVYKAVEEELKPAAKDLLTKAYEKMTVEREPSVVVKMKAESVSEGIVEWFKSVFQSAVDKVDAGVQNVAKLLGVTAEAA